MENKWESQINTASGTWRLDFTDGGGSFTITPSGKFYLSSIGDGSRGFLAEIAYLATAASSGGVTYTAVVSSSTGKVTIAVSSGTYSLDFPVGLTIRALLGFTGNLSAAASHTSPNATEAAWFPRRSYMGLYGVGDDGWTETDDTTTGSPDGTTAVIGFNKRTVNRTEYEGILGRFVRTSLEDTTNESLQTFYENTIYAEAVWAARGNDWRLYWDVDDDGSYVTYVLKNTNLFKPTPMVPDLTIAYNFAFDLAKKV